jgi:hypothetical protein
MYNLKIKFNDEGILRQPENNRISFKDHGEAVTEGSLSVKVH